MGILGASQQLDAALAQSAGTPGIQTQRTATRQAAIARATDLHIRDLTPGSVTVTVTVRQVITSTSGTSRTTTSYAITLTPAGGGWLAWDIEPAAAGNT